MSLITYPRTAAEFKALLSLGISEVQELLRKNGLRINLRAFMYQFYKKREHTKQELENICQLQLQWQKENNEKNMPRTVKLYHHTGAQELTGFSFQALNYEKKDRGQYLVQREKQWDETRTKFLIAVATDSESRKQLVEAGVPLEQIQRMEKGKTPIIDGKKYQVHHRIPLDDGGDNDLANLILIRDDVEHRAVHGGYNPAEKIINKLSAGESAKVAYPTPPYDTLIYPNPAKGYTSQPISNADYLEFFKSGKH